MGAINSYFKNNETVFGCILAGIILSCILLFVFSLIHVLRGNKHPFIILMNIMAILAPSFYLVHAYYINKSIWAH